MEGKRPAPDESEDSSNEDSDESSSESSSESPLKKRCTVENPSAWCQLPYPAASNFVGFLEKELRPRGIRLKNLDTDSDQYDLRIGHCHSMTLDWKHLCPEEIQEVDSYVQEYDYTIESRRTPEKGLEVRICRVE